MPKKEERGANATPRGHCITREHEVQTMHNIVLEILTNKPETRSSDRLLIEEVYNKWDVVNMPFWVVMEMGDLPSFETITRCRRKIQQTDETLRGTGETEEYRMARQLDIIEYAVV